MDITLLSKTMLFQGISPKEVKDILHCLDAKQKTYQKREVIYYAGDITRSLGIVLTGAINIEIDDVWGNKSILNHIEPGQIFAEAYACTQGEPLMVSAVSDANTDVLFLDTTRILQCSSSCIHHQKLIQNLLSVLAQKNLNLSRRILHTSSKTIRGRLISYFSFLAAKQESTIVTIPFNRQQLADYLSVDRSAMSNELSKMKKEGYILVDKNQITLRKVFKNI